MADEVAVFIDFENLRYGLLNNHGQEPDLGAIVEKAKKYGRPSVMRAYADFSEHPAAMRQQLQVAGIEAINIPVKRVTYSKGGKPIERIKNAADMVLALDAMVTALEADSVGKTKTFLLVAGDRDYIKLVTLLRNKFGQKVMVAGVPGCTAADLVTAAGGEDSIAVAPTTPVDKVALKRALVHMVRKGPAPLKYWSLTLIDQWSQNPKHGIPGTAKDRRDAIGDLKTEAVFTQQEIEDPRSGRKVTETRLDDTRAKELGY